MGEGNEPVLGHGSLALTDNLTLLYTCRYLHETAQAEAWRAEEWGRPFTVILVELTEIVRLNSREGYAAGDEAVQPAATAAGAWGWWSRRSTTNTPIRSPPRSATTWLKIRPCAPGSLPRILSLRS